MQNFLELSNQFSQNFSGNIFDGTPQTLYNPCNYFLSIGGKRIRPILCVMGNELFDTINKDAWHAANAIELFHNFSLVHDDIMDNADLRRGMPTIHTKYNTNTAILSGDVILIESIAELNKINSLALKKIISLFTTTAKQVCEGQQLDIDFETAPNVTLDAYLEMISLKTSVLLAASLKIGAIIGGASEANANQLYQFGLNLGIAFQIQDDYLDAFGDPKKFGKEVGGDIKQNKKTFLLIHALEVATPSQKQTIERIIIENSTNKVEQMLAIFKDTQVDIWASNLKEKYYQKAMQHLQEIAVTSIRKKPLEELAKDLLNRES
jgi:geranylgeranyl diphosphate synthase, type II